MRSIPALGRRKAPMLAELSDVELLSRVIASSNEAAFNRLVERYRRMVGNVCWRVLHHRQDVEDAVEQTFIVLWKKATSIRKVEALESWLHGVACRTASDIRKTKNRRKHRECTIEITQIT